MSYPHIYHKVYNEPWLIEPSAHRAICTALENHQSSPMAEGDPRFRDSVKVLGQDVKLDYFHRMGSIARVPIEGIIGKHMSLMETLCGGCDLAVVQKGLEQAMADPEIETIVLDINSPGGTVTGVPEFAAMVRRARDVKTVVAFTETLMCSAAMWIGAQAEMIFATPSARVGSIGVYRTWLDDSASLAQDGLKRELFEAGAHKAACLRPITEEERAIFQAEVDQIHADFKAEVTSQRPGVPDTAMQGLVYWGEKAMENGLVDAFVDCFTDLEDALK